MKHLEPDKLFSSFEEKERQESLSSPLDIYPWHRINSCITIIKNQKIYLTVALKIFKDLNPDSSEKTLQEWFDRGVNTIHQTAYKRIETLNINDNLVKQDLEKINKEDFISCLKDFLTYFEKTEEYEKCIHIKNFLDILST